MDILLQRIDGDKPMGDAARFFAKVFFDLTV